MDIHAFAQENPELYQALAAGVQTFIERHQITGETPMIEWAGMVDQILAEVGQDLVNEHEYIPAMAPACHGRGFHGGGHSHSGHSGGRGHSHSHSGHGRSSYGHPKSHMRTGYPGYLYGRPYSAYSHSDDRLRSILRLMFLEQLLR